MPKRKSNIAVTIITNKKSLKDITSIDKGLAGIDKDLGIVKTVDKESQTTEFTNADGFFEDERNHYLLLEIVANTLESSDIIIESVDGDQIDSFRETIKQLVEKLFSEIKSDPNKPDNKKQKFVKALIRIFSILLNANLSSVQKISKIIKQSAKLVINPWPGQTPLLDEATLDQKSLCLDRKEDQTSDSLQLETNPGTEN